MNTRFSFILLGLLNFASCDDLAMDNVYLIELRNQSNVNIKYHIAEPGSPLIYSDTLLPIEPMSFANLTSGGNTFRGNSEEWSVKIQNLPKDTLSIYIFNRDTIELNNWNTIRNDYKLLKRYDLSGEDLINLNYQITYPPTPEMENIRMFPTE